MVNLIVARGINNMKNSAINQTLSAVMTLIFLISLSNNSCAAENLAEAFTSGHTELSFRYRYEFVASDAFDRDANASTVRTRLNYSTLAYHGMTFFIELDHVAEVLGDNYNSGAGTSPNRTRFPVVADPTGTDLNQAWLNFNFSEHDFKLGRQRIIHDNQRFVGGVAWRQNEQTFDAATLDLDIAGSQLLLSYVGRVNRIFGDDVPAGDHENNTVLLNWSKLWKGQHRLSLFYYDIDNEDVSAFSTQTVGLSFDTFVQLQDNLLSIGIDYAQQADGSDNPVNFDANYWRIEGAFETPKVDVIVGREVLTGDANISGASFRTPLATLHAFNGWSDRFLATPNTGLKDTYIGMIGSHNDLGWYVRYHDFEAESISQAYGHEIDASISYRFTDRVSTRLKYAQYKSRGFSVDTRHWWFLLNFQF